MITHDTKIRVWYKHTDQMGFVHHSNYIRYFECARNTLMIDCGYPIEKCEEDGVTIPIVTVECRYRLPAKMGDVVRAVAMIDEVPMAKLHVRQAVYNQDGALCVEGKVTLGFLNKATGRPVRCPDKLVKAIEAHINDR